MAIHAPNETVYEDPATIEKRQAKLRRNSRIKIGVALVAGFLGGVGATLKFAYETLPSVIGVAVSNDSLERADRNLDSVPGFPHLMPDNNCHGVFVHPSTLPSFPTPATNAWDNLDRLHVTQVAIRHLEDVQRDSTPLVRERPWILQAFNRQIDVDCYHQVAGYYLPLLNRARDQYRGAIINAAQGTSR